MKLASLTGAIALLRYVINILKKILGDKVPGTTMLKKMSDTIKFLACDMVLPTPDIPMPMGLSDIMSVFNSFYKHNLSNPNWLNRDRVAFSAGTGVHLFIRSASLGI